LNGQVVDRPEAVRPLLAEAVGKTISARILRGGKLVNLEIAVTERPRKSK
jgi:S1-C subfamily serine protease